MLLIQLFIFIIILKAKTDEEMEEQEYKRRKALMSTTSIQSRSAENSQSQGKKFYKIHLSIRKVFYYNRVKIFYIEDRLKHIFRLANN